MLYWTKKKTEKNLEAQPQNLEAQPWRAQRGTACNGGASGRGFRKALIWSETSRI